MPMTVASGQRGGQKLGRIAGAAADIDDLARMSQRDLREQITRRARALVLEFEILLRAPVRHRQLTSVFSFLVLHPVRNDRVLAEPAHLVLFIILEVALEPFDVAVALERQDMRRDAVEEPAIVADDDGAAGEILQRFFQRAQRIDVEIVGRLVEQQHVGAGAQHLGQVHAVAFAARERADLLLLVGALEIERRAIAARIDLPLAEQDQLVAAGNLLPHRLACRRAHRATGRRSRAARTRRP